MKRGYAALFGKSLNFRINRKKGFRKILKPGNFDDLVKNHELNNRWLSKKVHIQGVVDGTFYDAINFLNSNLLRAYILSTFL
jgi:hypothetical protein